MTKGEAVRCIEDYELFECGNINGEEGCYICYSESNGKHMVYFPECGEWAELTENQMQYVKINPGLKLWQQDPQEAKKLAEADEENDPNRKTGKMEGQANTMDDDTTDKIMTGLLKK